METSNATGNGNVHEQLAGKVPGPGAPDHRDEARDGGPDDAAVRVVRAPVPGVGLDGGAQGAGAPGREMTAAEARLLAVGLQLADLNDRLIAVARRASEQAALATAQREAADVEVARLREAPRLLELGTLRSVARAAWAVIRRFGDHHPEWDDLSEALTAERRLRDPYDVAPLDKPRPSEPADQPIPFRLSEGQHRQCPRCGCRWRNNGDGTMALADAEQRSCEACEGAPWTALQALGLPPRPPPRPPALSRCQKEGHAGLTCSSCADERLVGAKAGDDGYISALEEQAHARGRELERVTAELAQLRTAICGRPGHDRLLCAFCVSNFSDFGVDGPTELRLLVDLLTQEEAKLRGQRHHDATWLQWQKARIAQVQKARARLQALLEPPAPPAGGGA